MAYSLRLSRTLCGATIQVSSRLGYAAPVAFAAACFLALANLRAVDSISPYAGTGDASLGEKGDLDQIEFEGLTTFNRDSVRNALAGDARLLLAAHPQAPVAEFLEMLRQKVLAGYQYNGFPNARISAAVSPGTGRVRVQVSEGTRYRCGRVQVTGTKAGPVAAIQARLTKPDLRSLLQSEQAASIAGGARAEAKDGANARVQTQVHLNIGRHDPRSALAAKRESSDSEPLWEPGEPAEFGEAATTKIEQAVKDCLAEYGLFFPRTRLGTQLNPGNGTADLLVQVLDEGPRGTVSELEVTGNRKNTREEILHFLGLKRGMAITRPRLVEAEQKLWRSARFLDYEITPEAATPGLTKATGVRLLVKVREYDSAPKLTKPFSDAQQALLRLCDWISDFASRPEDLLVSWVMKPPEFLVPMAADLIVSPSQGALVTYREPTSPSGMDYGMLFARETLGFFAPKRGCKLLVNKPDLVTRALISLAPKSGDAQKPFHLAIGGGFEEQKVAPSGGRAKPPFRLDLTLAPAAFLHFLDESNLVIQATGKTLTIISSNQVLKVDAKTGRLRELNVHYPDGSAEVRFVKGAFDQARRELEAAASGWTNRYDPDHPLSSLVSFAITDLARSSLLDKVLTNLPPVQRGRALTAINKLVSTSVLAPFDEAISANKRIERFDIPKDEADRALAENSLSAFYAAFGFRYCNLFFPKYSWPWTIARESVFVLANQATYADAELKRLYEAEGTGPVGCLVIAELLAKLNPPVAKTFALRGLTRLSATDFRSECRVFLEGESGLARTFANVAGALRDLPAEEVEALAAALPVEEACLLTDCAQALHSAPAQPLADSLGPALDNYWAKSLRARVRAGLRKLSVAAPSQAGPRT